MDELVEGVPTARTADLVDQLHAIVEELERRHPGRRFPLDGHPVGSIAEVEAQALFNIRLQPPSTTGHDAICCDGRAVEIKGTYRARGVAVRSTSHEHAAALNVVLLSRRSDQGHEVVYNSLSGLPPVLTIDNGWKQIPPQDIASFSAHNPTAKHYLPDGCGGQFTFKEGVPVGGFSGLPPVSMTPGPGEVPPSMHRPG